MLNVPWKCLLMRTTDGSIVMEVPADLAEALRANSGDELEIAKGRNGMFDLWKAERPRGQEALVDRSK